MRKIAIISRHAVANYGSLFQAHALEQVLRELEESPFTINYIKKNEQGSRLALTLLREKKDNFFKKTIFILYQAVSFEYTFNVFKKFRKRWLNETRLYSSVEELENDIPEADIYCTGSDQVWNKVSDGLLDSAYFLKFVSNDYKKIAYAASFGGTEILSEKNILADYLNKYDYISVREDNGLEVLNELGLKGEVVLDPTLLLDKKYWSSKAENINVGEKYILVYQLKKNQYFNKYVEEFAKKSKCKIIRVSAFWYQRFYEGKFVYVPRPEVVLGLFLNAEYVITDSFHATAFSINFSKQFVEILPGKYNSRNLSLLRLCGLENRIVDDYKDFSMIDKKINYEKVNGILNREREKSVRVLKSILEI